MLGALQKRIPKSEETKKQISSDWILDQFIEYVRERGVELYPAQEEAVLELLDGKNVILNTPTGSGKSLVALALHFDAIVQGRRSYYTSPIKALVNEKFFDLCRLFGAENVGMVTGDATVNAEAPIICCTAEILAMDALRDGSFAKVRDVVMDEFHYYADRERGVAWQVPLLCMPQVRFLLMSATMGNSEPFAKHLTNLNGLATSIVKSSERPVPLDFKYSEVPLHECVMELIKNGRAPIYLVSFTQRECAEEAQNFMSIDLCSKEEKQQIADALVGFNFSSPYGKELKKFLRHGMGLHHAGLLPKYRILVERLSQRGLLKIIFGTDTLGVGVNVPLRTVLFTKLCKFDGNKATILSVRDFHQIAGRAGRKGFDDLGTVVAQAPEHVIENQRNELKAAGDPKKMKKLVKKKPPEWGYVPWSQETFRRLISSESESLVSRFKVSHAMLLNVLSRPHEDGCRAMQRLIRQSHETPETKKKLYKKGWELFRSLVDRQIVELNPMRVNVDLQEDFSLNHALSLYLVDSLRLLDRNSPDYGLEVLTLTESILENPDLIIRKQLDRLKTEKMRELKTNGVEYEERMEELEKLEHPKPMRDFIYNTFNEFARKHPWLGEENIRPKSIAREMYEGFFSFREYIKEYDLQRAEGILLRYLSEVYKALMQNVPEFAKSDEVYEISVYFGTIVRQIDSSLIDEWERLRNPESPTQKTLSHESKNEEPEWDRKAFIIMLRNESFRFLKCLAQQSYEEALEILEAPGEFTEKTLEKIMTNYYQDGHQQLRVDAQARGTSFFKLITDSGSRGQGRKWTIEQTLVDTEGVNDWVVEFDVDVEKSKAEKRPILNLVKIESVTT
jgi:superfamily II RNA helicase